MNQQQHGLPVVNHLLQHSLRSICSESQWVYAVFWRILPRNYPPPKWDNETGFLDRSKGNKRNWILTWEDGFCDFATCAKPIKSGDASSSSDCPAERLQPELFFKMSHEVYSYGEGLMGKVASDSSHKWIFKDPAEQESGFASPWHGSLDPHPRTWEAQFKTGIQTIAIVAVQEGLLQLGSLEKVFEDLNLVILLQRKFTYLQSIPGVFAPHPNTLHSMMARPRLSLSQHHHRSLNYALLDDNSLIGLSEQQRLNLLHRGSSQPLHHQESSPVVGLKRSCSSEAEELAATVAAISNQIAGSSSGRIIPERPPLSKSLNTGHSPPGVVSHLQPSMMSSLHALLSKLPSVSGSSNSELPPPAASSPGASAQVPLTRSLSMPKQFSHQLQLINRGDENDRPAAGNLQQSLSCKAPKSSLLPADATTKGNTSGSNNSSSTSSSNNNHNSLTMTKDRLSLFLEAFENVNEYGIQNSELEAYNSFLSEIIN